MLLDSWRGAVSHPTNTATDAETPRSTSRPRTRAQTTTNAASANTQACPTDQAAASSSTTAGPDTLSKQQLLLYLTQQQQQYQAQMQTQLQAQMQQANSRFEYLVASRGEQKKKDPPMYEGKYGEDIELWIFATEQYYASRRELMEKRFFFQNGLREETARKIKEESPSTLQDAIEIASNFEFAHYSGKPLKLWQRVRKDHRARGIPKRTEANRYMKGALYAILEAEARAFKTEDQKRPVTIFIDNGSSLNGVTEKSVKKLELDVTEGDMMQVDLGYDQVVHRPRRTVDMSLQLPGFPLTTGTFQVMPVPEGKDVVLDLMWLREQNPDIDWNTGQIAPRIKWRTRTL
ncbi:unnamed protein product [Phytophthora lilii]|uniref:Unnamed protein product n=1 Tax=Phytophthora lilii TaxID=2077276 RepID=A0A9W6XJ60_9STRA|nr:unnamed protein product [Phytophthora lilii]